MMLALIGFVGLMELAQDVEPTAFSVPASVHAAEYHGDQAAVVTVLSRTAVTFQHQQQLPQWLLHHVIEMLARRTADVYLAAESLPIRWFERHQSKKRWRLMGWRESNMLYRLRALP